MTKHKEQWNERTLQEAGFEFSYFAHCKTCMAEIAHYNRRSDNKWMRLDEGTMEMHECYR